MSLARLRNRNPNLTHPPFPPRPPVKPARNFVSSKNILKQSRARFVLNQPRGLFQITPRHRFAKNHVRYFTVRTASAARGMNRESKIENPKYEGRDVAPPTSVPTVRGRASFRPCPQAQECHYYVTIFVTANSLLPRFQPLTKSITSNGDIFSLDRPKSDDFKVRSIFDHAVPTTCDDGCFGRSILETRRGELREPSDRSTFNHSLSTRILRVLRSFAAVPDSCPFLFIRGCTVKTRPKSGHFPAKIRPLITMTYAIRNSATIPDLYRRPVWICVFPRKITKPSPRGLVDDSHDY